MRQCSSHQAAAAWSFWRLFEAAIRNLGLNWRVIGADSDSSCATALAAGTVHRVPRLNDPAYADAIVQLVRRERVVLIVPTIDTELQFFARLELPGVLIATSGPETVSLTRDKLRTAQWATASGLAVPDTALLSNVNPTRYSEWVVKPRDGSSSVGLQLGLTPSQLQTFRDTLAPEMQSSWIAQPLLDGPEFTVNCFIDSGRCVYAVPHLRVATRGGEVSHAITACDSDVEALVRQAVLALPDSSGPLCAQVISDRQSGPLLIEINARFGGGYPVADQAGARGPERLLRQAAGLPTRARVDSWEPGVEMVRFDQSVFRHHVSLPPLARVGRKSA